MKDLMRTVGRTGRDNFIIIAVILIVAVFGFLSEGFFSASSAQILLNQLPTLMVVTIGMILVMLVGGIDLSVGSVVALSSTLVATMVVSHSLPVPVAMLVGIIAGLLLGGASGWLSTYAGLPSFIVTLGVLEAGRGLAYLSSGSQTIFVGPSIEGLSLPIPGLGLSPAFLIAIGITIIAHVLITRSVGGRYLLAIGTREAAARAAGISTKPYKLAAFAISGALAGLGGVFNAAYLAAADPNAGTGLELSAIAAAVIGGTSLMGGRGSVIGGFIGVLLIAVLQSGLAQIGVSEPVKRIVTGTVIILAVLLDRWRASKND
ncbi:ABC transporter permease [Sphingobium chlorophenolicum]|uniref:L-arabinose transporter permease protein n=1 Tax=Sphingobium chlorophenolicum TaxID=46429 RepID=A0A081RF03_SPHCR|nr:ABC transporter permease [Sphingobium chlorophenolicum]KEQ53776.1 L-arabinose transporter permease protein [Sphingobium chlorophenolicum]